MSASEFGNWLAFLEEEPIGTGPLLSLWAELMAALHNGPIGKKGRGRWVASDFARARWVATSTATTRKTGIAELRKHIQALKPKP